MKLNNFLPLVIAAFIVFFTSCEKSACSGLVEDVCQEACQVEPVRGWCGTPPVTMKYYFNQTTQQCEAYIYAGGDAPFETLQECEACACTETRIAPFH
jgi:hypothetical protein